MKSVSLYFTAGSSDKEYHAAIAHSTSPDAYDVTFRYGRRGNALTCGVKATALPLAKAETVFNALVKEKKGKGYVEAETGTPYVGSTELEAGPYLPQLLNAVGEHELPELIANPRLWCMQEKMDGKRLIVSVESNVQAYNRRGLSCGIPEVIARDLLALELTGSVLDGELVGETYHVFDVLKFKGTDMTNESYLSRYLVSSWITNGSVKAVLYIPTEERFHLGALKDRGAEGVVFKRLDAPYSVGRPNAGGPALKYKFVESSTCIVASVSETKRSIGLTMFDDVNDESGSPPLVDIGNVTVPANQSIPRVGDLVEVRYLYRYEQGSLYQPVLVGLRDDLQREACTTSQITRIKRSSTEAENE